MTETPFQDQPLAWYRNNYVYEESGGRDVEVYIVNTGANLNNVEFTNDDNGGKKGHGTCILSRMGGHIHGIAKNTSTVIVRMPRRPAAVNPVEDYLKGIQKIVDDVASGNKRAVVSKSWFYPRQLAGGVFTFKDVSGDDASDAPRDTLRRLLRLLASKGVSLVTGSGNNGVNSIDGFPAEFGNPNAGLNYTPRDDCRQRR
ncbi:serine protease [Neonectria magnoliae]|uniref:Serine protease n=1 Tax=Neonectria magnoliae TaxID=2732573 RepID=A0ABR1HIW0_9HYPO